MVVRIGTSGWSYDHWQDVLYPPGMPPAQRLARYCEVFDTVELNASFYRWPRDSTFGSWRRRLPEGFVMSVKAPRGLTHGRRLYAPEPWSERFGRAWAALGEHAGMLLVQLPPDQQRDDARLECFLTSVPSAVPVALELRHPSWVAEEIFQILERHDAAYVVTSGAGLPCVLRATSAVVYLRLHGPDHDHLYSGSYSDPDLQWWADRIREWSDQRRDVYAYFNNDGFGNAVRNALTLREQLR